MKSETLRKLLELGVSLSAEKNYDYLLDSILSNAMQMVNCDAGAVCLKEGDYLSFKVVRIDTMHIYQGEKGAKIKLLPISISDKSICALSLSENKIISIKDIRECKKYDVSEMIRYDKSIGYFTKSVLVIPIKNGNDEPIGALQLINARTEAGRVSNFKKNKVMIAESIALQAATAIQNMKYVKEIRALFHSFVKVMSTAIDERTPYNAAHTRNMVKYGERFLEFINQKRKEQSLEMLQKQEIFMSIWLHDIGKLVTPLSVMNKSTRLQPGVLTEIFHRFDLMNMQSNIDKLEKRISQEEEELCLKEIDEAKKLIERANIAGVITEDTQKAIEKLGIIRFRINETEDKPLLSKKEIKGLSIQKGTLSEEERLTMENHVVVTAKLLAEIDFSKEYLNVPFFAAGHHEYLDGSGYPNQLKGDKIPIEVRIITILDIFDALTADDRPYKPGMSVEEALAILQDMAQEEGKLDYQLVDWFIESRCWE